MRLSEYQTQANINDRMNQQHGLDSVEGSAALLQANKPEVDATDIQKARILAQDIEKQNSVPPSTRNKPNNFVPRPISSRNKTNQTR